MDENIIYGYHGCEQNKIQGMARFWKKYAQGLSPKFGDSSENISEIDHQIEVQGNLGILNIQNF